MLLTASVDQNILKKIVCLKTKELFEKKHHDVAVEDSSKSQLSRTYGKKSWRVNKQVYGWVEWQCKHQVREEACKRVREPVLMDNNTHTAYNMEFFSF